MSSPTRTTAAPCSLCGRVLPVCRKCNIRTHGPVTSRCPGSSLPPSLVNSPSSNASIASAPLPLHRPAVSQVHPPLHSFVINPGRINCSIRPEPSARRSCHPSLTILLKKTMGNRGIIFSSSAGVAWLGLAGEAIEEASPHVSIRPLSERRTALQAAGRATVRRPWLKGFQQRWKMGMSEVQYAWSAQLSLCAEQMRRH